MANTACWAYSKYQLGCMGFTRSCFKSGPPVENELPPSRSQTDINVRMLRPMVLVTAMFCLLTNRVNQLKTERAAIAHVTAQTS